MNGFLLVDKPEDITSRQAMLQCLPQKSLKAGIEGILDPFATGLLVVGLGSFTRFFEYFDRLPKTYRALLKLGEETDSLDSTGTVVNQAPLPGLEPGRIQSVLKLFCGEIEQVPPVFSNIKIEGQTARSLARRGEKVEMKPRKALIHKIKLVDYHAPYLDIECEVGRGTYIRSLARDIGYQLNTVAHLVELRRTAIGHLSVKQAMAPAPARPENLFSEKEVLVFFDELHLSSEQAHRILTGRASLLDAEAGVYRLYSKGIFLGLGRADGHRLGPEKLLPTN